MREVNLTGAIQKLLIALAKGKRLPPIPTKLKITQLLWGERDLSHLAQDLTVDGAKIVASCAAGVSSSSIPELQSLEDDTLRNQPIQGKAEGGLAFSSQHGGHSGTEIGGGSSSSYVQFLSAFSWHVVPDSGSPSLWFAQIAGQLEFIVGNLGVSFQRGPTSSSSVRGLRLEGAYTYYLLAQIGTKDWYLVIDTAGSGAPSPQDLWCDFLALQFTLGRQLKVGTLHGVDDSGEVVAWASGAYASDHPGTDVQPPVPPVNMTTPQWTVPFFAATSNLMRNRKELRPGIALLTYVDSLTDNVDAAFIRLAVGLEGFAFWLLAGAPEEIIVHDKKAWIRWAQDRKTEIRAFAKDDKLANKLYGKVEFAYKRASGKVVQDAFASFGMTTTEELDEILDLRDYAIHRGVMLKEGQTYEIDREMANIAKARVMLVALVARAAGYRGAITGWGRPEGYHHPELEGFWEVSPEALDGERVF